MITTITITKADLDEAIRRLNDNPERFNTNYDCVMAVGIQRELQNEFLMIGIASIYNKDDHFGVVRSEYRSAVVNLETAFDNRDFSAARTMLPLVAEVEVY